MFKIFIIYVQTNGIVPTRQSKAALRRLVNSDKTDRGDVSLDICTRLYYYRAWYGISISVFITDMILPNPCFAVFIPFLLDSLREPLYIDIFPYYHLKPLYALNYIIVTYAEY